MSKVPDSGRRLRISVGTSQRDFPSLRLGGETPYVNEGAIGERKRFRAGCATAASGDSDTET
jgi:hypothetical protein